jgi:hypothetical protein
VLRVLTDERERKQLSMIIRYEISLWYYYGVYFTDRERARMGSKYIWMGVFYEMMLLMDGNSLELDSALRSDGRYTNLTSCLYITFDFRLLG